MASLLVLPVPHLAALSNDFTRLEQVLLNVWSLEGLSTSSNP